MRIHEVDVKASGKPPGVVTEVYVPRRQIIQYGGQRFDCSTEMAQIFLKHAREVIESGDQQLVPLLHSGGIELLLVSRLTPYSIFVSEETGAV